METHHIHDNMKLDFHGGTSHLVSHFNHSLTRKGIEDLIHDAEKHGEAELIVGGEKFKVKPPTEENGLPSVHKAH